MDAGLDFRTHRVNAAIAKSKVEVLACAFYKRYMTEIIAAAVGAIIGALTLWLLELPAKRRANADKTELATIRRRARGPYLFPSDATFDCLYLPPGDQGQIPYHTHARGDLLCFTREEVERDIPAGHPIIFVIENRGEDIPEVTMNLAGDPVQFHREPELADARGLQFILYPYRPDKHGQPQTLEVRFLARDGVRDVHRYYIEHGRRILRRIDPA
jgi:hypothetical protein